VLLLSLYHNCQFDGEKARLDNMKKATPPIGYKWVSKPKLPLVAKGAIPSGIAQNPEAVQKRVD